MCHKFENGAIGSVKKNKKTKKPKLFSKEIFALTREISNPKYPKLFSKEIFALTREISNPNFFFFFFFS